MKAYERFLKYVAVWTASDENSKSVPTTKRQLDLGALLVEEMKALGLSDVKMDEYGYVYGYLPATEGMEAVPALGLIAHLDTAPDYNGRDVKPQLIENYDGKDVELGTSGKVLTVKDFPRLSSYKGRTLITTDGTSLLGADDKAGIAEILTVVEELIKEKTPHGKLCIAFTPDEEVGGGADYLKLSEFGAVYGYTLDGSHEGEIQFENFNAAGAEVIVHGVNVHPGSAKDIMKNAQTIAMELHGMLPKAECPEKTEGYEGFYHLMEFNGTVEQAVMKYIIRDFDPVLFDVKQEKLRQTVAQINAIYGEGTAEVKIEESYRNMREKIEPCMQLIEYAKAACKEAGVEPDVSPIRGGTDGARLSFRGLPCPNLGTGGDGFHGPFEHITVEGMDLSVEIVKKIIKKM
ncbi:peptidase T [Firmicutes bacterium AM10-47]|nr:peptidase T [Firmicutes bacterium AM10-47]